MAKKATTKPATKKTAAKSTNGKSSSGSNDDGATSSAAGAEAQQLDPAVLEKITELRSKVNETFGQVALAMMAIPRYRHQSVGDLNHILLEPLIRDREAIASAEKNQEASEGSARSGKKISDPTKAPLAGVAIWASVKIRGQFISLRRAVTCYLSKTVPEFLHIREQIKAGVFPIRLKGDEWNSGSNNWLLDIIAPNQQLTTAVIANFGQVVKDGDLKIHPLITCLVDPEVLKKMGAAPA